MAIQADLGVEKEVVRAFEAVDQAFGCLGGLVNNAVFAGEPTRLEDLHMDHASYVTGATLDVAGGL